jgi:hypothetical protein
VYPWSERQETVLVGICKEQSDLLVSKKKWKIIMIHLIKDRATPEQIQQMLEAYPRLIKIVVDTRRRILAGGGEMHADCEAVLLLDGSEQDDLWGANWYPQDQRVEFESLINIRPRLGNRSISIQDENRRTAVDEIAHTLIS